MVGGPVLLIALAGAWLAYQNWDRLFPNSQEEAASGPNLSQDPIARAERLHKAGKTPIAINQLKRLPSTDPHYRQAQKLIAEWGGGSAAPEALAAPGTQSTAAAPGAVPVAAPVVLDRRQLLLISAREAFEERMYIKAVRRLEQAAAMAKLDGSDAQLLTDAQAHIEPLAKQLGAFRDHEWEYVLPDLWRMREANPNDRDVNQLIVDCYYNLGLRDLQRADTTKAAEKFKEALNLQKDESIQRHLLFAQTYQQRPKDLLYKIYVKYLQYR
jgi:tetratricopeptide (TPR) repeat protein